MKDDQSDGLVRQLIGSACWAPRRRDRRRRSQPRPPRRPGPDRLPQRRVLRAGHRHAGQPALQDRSRSAAGCGQGPAGQAMHRQGATPCIATVTGTETKTS